MMMRLYAVVGLLVALGAVQLIGRIETARAAPPVMVMAGWSDAAQCVTDQTWTLNIEDFVKQTLPGEWPLSTGEPEAVKAGASTIRQDFWYFYNNPEDQLGLDYCDPSNPFAFHVRESRFAGFDPGAGALETAVATDATRGKGWDPAVGSPSGLYLAFGSNLQNDTVAQASNGATWPQIVGSSTYPPGQYAPGNCCEPPGSIGVSFPMTAVCLYDGFLDPDNDCLPDPSDNCPSSFNPLQENFDAAGIGNGASIPGHDTTVPNGDGLGDACDSDDDNDGLTDGGDGDPRGDLTYDDNGNGIAAFYANPSGTDPADDGPSWDRAPVDGKRDGASGDCTSPGSSTVDADSDGMREKWERCKWGTSDLTTNSDGEGPGDCQESMDVNGNGVVSAADGTLIARAFTGIDAMDGVFDINGNGFVAAADRTLVLRAATGIDVCL